MLHQCLITLETKKGDFGITFELYTHWWCNGDVMLLLLTQLTSCWQECWEAVLWLIWPSLKGSTQSCNTPIRWWSQRVHGSGLDGFMITGTCTGWNNSTYPWSNSSRNLQCLPDTDEETKKRSWSGWRSGRRMPGGRGYTPFNHSLLHTKTLEWHSKNDFFSVCTFVIGWTIPVHVNC